MKAPKQQLRARQLDMTQLRRASGGRGSQCGAVMHCDCGASEGLSQIDLGYCEFIGWLGTIWMAGNGTCPNCGANYYA